MRVDLKAVILCTYAAQWRLLQKVIIGSECANFCRSRALHQGL